MLFGKPKDAFEVYNDFDSELVNLFRVVKDRNLEFLLELGLLPLNSREDFFDWVDFNTGGYSPEPFLDTQIEIIDAMVPQRELAEQMKQILHQRVDNKAVRQAAAYFKRMRNSYSSSGRSYSCQPFNLSTTFDLLREANKRLEEVVVEHQSFEILIPHYDREDSFFYLDPPYVRSEYVYDTGFTWEQHVLMRDMLAGIKGKCLISQADFPEVRELYKDFFILEFKRIHSMAQRNNPGTQFGELLIGNYDLLEREKDVPQQLSMSELMGQPINVEQILKERIIPCKNRIN